MLLEGHKHCNSEVNEPAAWVEITEDFQHPAANTTHPVGGVAPAIISAAVIVGTQKNKQTEHRFLFSLVTFASGGTFGMRKPSQCCACFYLLFFVLQSSACSPPDLYCSAPPSCKSQYTIKTFSLFCFLLIFMLQQDLLLLL